SHSVCRLYIPILPPLQRGRTWSSTRHIELPQRRHAPPSRANTLRRRFARQGVFFRIRNTRGFWNALVTGAGTPGRCSPRRCPRWNRRVPALIGWSRTAGSLAFQFGLLLEVLVLDLVQEPVVLLDEELGRPPPSGLQGERSA